MCSRINRASWLTLIFCLCIGPAKAQLNAAFSSAVTQGCAPLSQVAFMDLSTGNPTSWLWNFGNGNTSTLQNPTASYPNPGIYTVSLTVGDGSQTDTETKTGYITVFEGPVASFSFSPVNPCAGNPVTFISNSLPGDAPVATWNWDFGDGNVLTTTTGMTSHTYSAGNAYPVSVIITDTNGCSDNFDTVVVVVPVPVAGLSFSPTFYCNVPATVSFSNNSVAAGNASYLWYFGDGSTSSQVNPQHTYTSPGNYFVSLVVELNSNCRDSITYATPVNVGGPVITLSASDTSVCDGEAILFSFNSVPPPVAYQWDFGDGTTSAFSPIFHVFPGPGNYSVSVTAFDGNGCSSTESFPAVVNPAPVAAYGPVAAAGCQVPYSVQFQDSSQGAIAWNWNFGDGDTAIVQQPSHAYSAPGTYSVTLVVTNSFGCTDTTTGTVAIVPPTAGMSLSPRDGCLPLNVSFTSTSNAIEPISQYYWNFGAGQGGDTTSSPGTAYTYNTVGIYTVSLIIETMSGCRDTITDTVRVGDHVTPNFTISDDTVCYNETVSFMLNTPGANGWYWYFGDGSVDSTQQNPTHQYGDPGTYTVTLVACQNGCCDTLVMPDLITILAPKAQISPDPHDCANPYTITFNNTSVDADSSVWDFGDGNMLVSNAGSVVHTYGSRGTYVIWLFTWNFTTGCVDSISLTYQVTDPVADFTATPLSGCYPLQVAFADSSIDDNARTWDFGDGNSFPGAPNMVTHTYMAPGYYTVTYTIADVHGCIDSIVKNQYIHAYGPVAGFSASPVSGCRPLVVSFSDSTVSEYPVVQYIWDYGDGSSDTIATPGASHVYASNGIYSVTLIAIDSTGCTDTLLMPQLINVTYPAPAMAVDTFACMNEVLTFNGQNSSAATPVNVYWDFGDGTLDTTVSAVTTHAYATEGSYTWQMTISDVNGCDSAISGTVLVEHPDAGFTYTENPGCGFNQIMLTDTSTGTAIAGAFWSATNGFSSTNWPVANANFVNPGAYSVTLVSINAAGCTDTVTENNIIVVPGPVGNMTFVPDTGCVPLVVTFTLSSPNTLYYILDYGDGGLDSLPSSTSTIQHTYLNDTTITPILYMATLLPNGSTCEIPYTFGSIVTTSQVTASISADGDTVPEVQATAGTVVQLSAISGGMPPLSYLWYPAAGLTGTLIQDPLLTVPSATGYYFVEITDANGCTGLDSILVRVVDCNEDIGTYNVITPNGDGLNDEFVITNPCYDGFLLLVFNRWGQKVFESGNPDNRWRGYTTDGKELPEGTYYWIISSGESQLKGYVQLIRN